VATRNRLVAHLPWKLTSAHIQGHPRLNVTRANPDGYTLLFSVWNTVLVPAGTPKPIIARLHGAIAKSLQSAGLRETYSKMGVMPEGSSTPEDARAYLTSEIGRYAKLVKAIGLKID